MSPLSRRAALAALFGGAAAITGVGSLPGDADALPLLKDLEPLAKSDSEDDGLVQLARWRRRRRRRVCWVRRGRRVCRYR